MTRVRDHRCAHPRCPVEVAGYQLACLSHWRQLPPPLRAAILEAWQQRRRGRSDNDPAVDTHLALVLEAMDFWRAVR